MKNLEELSRIHIDEIIQRGLDAQRIHRALSNGKERDYLQENKVPIMKRMMRWSIYAGRTVSDSLLRLNSSFQRKPGMR